METKSPKLLDQVRQAIRTKHYSYRTEQTYVEWVKRFIHFHDKRHPKDMGAEEVQSYITYLANERNVAASTQNQALMGIVLREVHRLNSLIADFLLFARPISPGRERIHLNRVIEEIVVSDPDGWISCVSGNSYIRISMVNGTVVLGQHCWSAPVGPVAPVSPLSPFGPNDS
jgi:hypothetical protein